MPRTNELLRELTRIHALTTSEAETLLCSRLRTVRHRLYLEPREVRDDQYQEILRLVKLLKKNVPIQYLLKQAQFLEHELYVEEGVFIPRPETEGLVFLAGPAPKAAPGVIIDVGVGSGCISIALAHLFPNAEIYGIDISDLALAVAARNVKAHGLDRRIHLVKSDLFGRLDRRVRADLLISNPPYIRTADIPGLPDSVRSFEPWAALDGGPDGTAFIRRLLDGASGFLKPDFRIALEIDPGTTDLLKNHLNRLPRFAGYRFERDLAGRSRYLVIDSQ